MAESHPHGRRLGRLPLAVLVAFTASVFAWLALVNHWLPMPGDESHDHGVNDQRTHDHGSHDHGTGESAMEMTDPGVPEAMALTNGVSGIGLYLLMWGVMMIAMMYPSTIPLFRLYEGTLRDAPATERLPKLGAFMGTYAVVWGLTGIVPLLVNWFVPIAPIAAGNEALLLGASLLVLASYQVSPYKQQCLDYCRSPLGFLTAHHRPGVSGAIRLSGRFSVFCVGCCWALMGLMVVVGSMNVLWMAIITVVLSLERLVSWGPQLATAIGVLAGGAGIGLLVGSLPVV